MKEHPARRQAPRLRLNQMKYDSQHLMVRLDALHVPHLINPASCIHF